MKSLPIIAVFLTVLQCTYGQSLQRAQLFNDHNLQDDSKRECILIITSESSNTDKASALYLLGSIAFDQNRITSALESWTQLIEAYPESKEATEVSERISELAQIVGDSQRESLDNAFAQSYLRHGDFWSRGKSSIITIDSSWIPNVETAIKWYDKTIAEFPNTTAAKIALEEKMKTILGWEEPGRYGSKNGMKEDPAKYLPMLIGTFREYEKQFPNSGTIQSYRYQIAQAYWSQKNWDKTREWLNKIIKIEGEADTFYSDLAKRRLQKVEF